MFLPPLWTIKFLFFLFFLFFSIPFYSNASQSILMYICPACVTLGTCSDVHIHPVSLRHVTLTSDNPATIETFICLVDILETQDQLGFIGWEPQACQTVPHTFLNSPWLLKFLVFLNFSTSRIPCPGVSTLLEQAEQRQTAPCWYCKCGTLCQKNLACAWKRESLI